MVNARNYFVVAGILFLALTSLAQHGYEIKGAHGLGRRYARIQDAVIVCVVDWGVYWRTDNAGIASEVEDDVYTACW